MVTVTVHGVLVTLKKGDITKETVDVIVNSNNKSLDLNTGMFFVHVILSPSFNVL